MVLYGIAPSYKRGRPVQLSALGALALIVLGAPGCRQQDAPPLRLVTTTSVKDSGLLDTLLPAFRVRHGFDVGVVAVGTGIAIRLAQKGEADVVITHDRVKEEAFVREGDGLDRRVFAASDFVVVGPPADPARVRGLDALSAFQKIASSSAPFASRGDSSGTHARELSLWKAAALVPPTGRVEVRAGMATTLRYASDRDAYTLTDRATYLAHHDNLQLAVLVEDDPLLANLYAVMVVNPRKHPEADSRRAAIFADWLLSDEARELIRGFTRAGLPLFHVPVADAN
ncbi:MAG: substrate-binding domain-containing protein [Gemmatimonadetes bacterium]|nr:substrate-binding domain-containing protein [Gemmatimonadota bacterium]